MNIGIIATHSFPIPHRTHTGDSQVLTDLSQALAAMGHTVTLYAPSGSVVEGIEVIPMLSSEGQAEPTAQQCESDLITHFHDRLRQHDIVHDFSVNKTVATWREKLGLPHIQTYLGAPYDHGPRSNACVWSESQRKRAAVGASDYEDTPLQHLWGSPRTTPVNAHVVYGGVDCDLYRPLPDSVPKDSFYLWMNRWHPAKGFREFIRLAGEHPKTRFVLAGASPNDEWSSQQALWAREAYQLAEPMQNVRVCWLPPDPYHHTAKIDLYQRARALLYPVAFAEPFGLAMVEAMACDTPVFAPDRGSCRGLGCLPLEDFTEGVPPRGEMRAHALRHFTREKMAERYANAYALILDGQGWS